MSKINIPLIMVLVTMICGSCHVARYVVWNFADIRDHRKFPAKEVAASTHPHRFLSPGDKTFHEPSESDLLQLGFSGGGWEKSLKKSGTLAFLVIRNDTLLYENYFRGYDRQRIIPSFSVAKTFTATLAGIALQKGRIGLDDPITDYLDYLPKAEFQQITIRDLLNMRSGIAFNESYVNPFGDAAKLYYGVNIPRQLRALRATGKPDQVFDYNSVNTQLLGQILEKVTGVPLQQQLEKEIWKPGGMEYSATWSVDSKSRNTVKAFCCLNARPIDFAKLGQLYLNKGQLSQEPIFSTRWYDQSVKFDTAMNYLRYRMGWWFLPSRENLTDTTDLSGLHFIWRDVKDNVRRELVYKPLNDFYAEGILGQFVYVNPEKKMVIVRMGKKSGKVDWIKTFRRISEINSTRSIKMTF